MDILEKIIASKKHEISNREKKHDRDDLKTRPYFKREVYSMSAALTQASSSHIIAEFKRQSPSKGVINDQANVLDVARGYEKAGCAGVSILTDGPYFGGAPEDILTVREHIKIPILRKDFIIDEYQIFEAKAMGADLILLIAEALTKKTVHQLAKCARLIGLEVLLEMHSQEQLDKICDEVNIIGVNNRNLKEFKVDIETSLSLAEQLPAGFVNISESGINSADTIIKLMGAGYQGFLIGENFMRSDDPAAAAEGFVRNLQSLKQLW